MSLTEINRRSMLASTASLGLVGCLNRPSSFQAKPKEHAYASAFTTYKRENFFGILSETGQVLATIPVDERGHGVCSQQAGDDIVLISRRPGRSCSVISRSTHFVTHHIQAALGRHFYGHGCFSPDGNTLYLTENDYETGQGVIGVYDASAKYERRGEITTHGVGPHEIGLMPDGETLVVANGGIQTHPSAPRQKMNLASMRPSVAFLDRKSGDLKQIWFIQDPHLQRLSLRHLDIHPTGLVIVVCQWEGKENERPPLIAACGLDTPLTFLDLPHAIQRQMRNYCGSVCFDSSGEQFAVSSPRGDMISLWSKTGRFEQSVTLQDGSGIAAHPKAGFILTSGTGQIRYSDPMTRSTRSTPYDWHWDNHIYAV